MDIDVRLNLRHTILSLKATDLDCEDAGVIQT